MRLDCSLIVHACTHTHMHQWKKLKFCITMKAIDGLFPSAGGEFGAMMQVHIQNDGPVTLQFETPQLPPLKEARYHGDIARCPVV